MRGLVAGRPRSSRVRVARPARDDVVVRPDDADRDRTPAETANDRQSAVARADHHGARQVAPRRARSVRDLHRRQASASAGCAVGGAAVTGRPVRCAASARPVNGVPETNFITGPKLAAVNAPTK